MPLTKQIELLAQKDIIDSINNIIDRYLAEGLTINQIKKYFTQKAAINTLIYDISEAGAKYFDDNKEYKHFVYKILKELLFDRKSEIETMKLQKESNTVTKFNEFKEDSINEAVDYSDLTAEYLFNDIGFANDDIDILADYFKTKEDYIEVKNQDYCVYTMSDFKTDITKNNRVKMDVLFLADFQIEKMINNVTRKIISGIYEKIPQDVEYMGILVKPHTIMDKEKLKESVDTIVEKNILNIISTVTNYKYEAKHGDNYHIWKKVK